MSSGSFTAGIFSSGETIPRPPHLLIQGNRPLPHGSTPRVGINLQIQRMRSSLEDCSPGMLQSCRKGGMLSRFLVFQIGIAQSLLNRGELLDRASDKVLLQ
jgi:hypothetical protein